MSVKRSRISAPVSWSDFRWFFPDFYSFPSFFFKNRHFGPFEVLGDFPKAHLKEGPPLIEGNKNFCQKTDRFRDFQKIAGRMTFQKTVGITLLKK